MLLESGHYASDEVKEKLLTLDEDKNALFQRWEERRILYEQCMDLQLFYRDTEQADSTMLLLMSLKEEHYFLSAELCLWKKVLSEEPCWKTPTNTNSLRETAMKQKVG